MISQAGLLACLSVCLLCFSVNAHQPHHHNRDQMEQPSFMQTEEVPCTCGVFLDSQTALKGAVLKEGEESKSIFSYPVEATLNEIIPVGLKGKKICTKKCIEGALKFIHTGPQILCSYLGKDIFNERVHLFIKNKDNQWQGTKLNSGRAFTCKDGQLVK